MVTLNIIPQKFSFEKPTITNRKREITSHGINVSIDINAFKANKTAIKKDLAAIFAEVLEYFDWFYQAYFFNGFQNQRRNRLYTTFITITE